MMVQTYREALRCEVHRAEVFAGRKSPLILGEPDCDMIKRRSTPAAVNTSPPSASDNTWSVHRWVSIVADSCGGRGAG